MNKIVIRPENENDFDAIDQLVKDSFKYGTPFDTDGTPEVALIHEIRSKKYYIPELAFVATINKELVGHFMLSYLPLAKDTDSTYPKAEKTSTILMLTPVAVKWGNLRQGIGSEMLRQGIQKVKEMSCIKGIMVEGNPAFYHKVGFEPSYKYDILPVKTIELPHQECMMLLETYPDSLKDIKGAIDYSMYENA